MTIAHFVSCWPEIPPVTLYRFDTVASTNTSLWECLDRDRPSLPCAAIARVQTAGRGQWGRQWLSPEGGLYLSLALSPQIPATDSAHLSLLSAWGVARALNDRGLPVRIKWPNDLIWQGRKLGGILCETRISQGAIARAVIGIGINWRNPVPDNGINLASTSVIASLDELTRAVLDGLLTGDRAYRRQGIAAIVAGYETLLDSIGRRVTLPEGEGIAIGITHNGQLRIRLENENQPLEVLCSPGTISLGYAW